MDLNNFTEKINDKILGRGYSYYKLGAIVDESNIGDGEYCFIVRGTYDYEVEVKINENKDILDSNCNCPYDFGPICKHEVAVYYYLNDFISNAENKINVKTIDLKELLGELRNEELIEIIVKMAEKDKTIKENIIFRYSKYSYEEELAIFRKILGSKLDKYLRGEGYIHYNETYYFANEIGELLIKGIDKSINNDNPMLAVDIIFIIFEEVLNAFQYADDSNGEIGMLADEAIENLNIIVKDYIDNKHVKKEIFDKILDNVDMKVLDSWQDYRIDLLEICFEFADEKIWRERLKRKIQELIDKNEKDVFNGYYKERLLVLLYEITDTYGSGEEAEELIKNNIEYEYFRQLLIDKYKKEKNFLKVVNLALEGEKQDEEFPGLVNVWKKERYEAYKKLSLKDEQDKLGRELLLSGNFEYYEELKSLHKGNEKNLYNEILREIKDNRVRYWNNVYLELIIYEGDLEEILNFTRNNPIYIERFADMLINDYREDVIKIYRDYIFQELKLASNRKKYRQICESIKKIGELTTNKEVEKLIDELSLLHSNRPALLDELNKI